MNFLELIHLLHENKAEKIYLIHEENRENETRNFAQRLRNLGFIPLIGADFRKGGERLVRNAIEKADLCILLAFDEETKDYAEKMNIPFLEVFI